MVLEASLDSFAFSHDMLLNVPLIVEQQTIYCNNGALVNDSLLKSNQMHINNDYFVWQQVLKYDQTIKDKLAIKTFSLFSIVSIHMNGTITI